MPIEIPAPDVPPTATWKANAEQKGEETVYNYEIKYEDGSTTFRTVTEVNGVRTVTAERNVAGTKSEADEKRKPIPDPQNLPKNSTFDARRVIFTDEENKITTTIKYTIYTVDAKYTQEEVHHPDGQLTVTKGDPLPLTAEDQKIFNSQSAPSVPTPASTYSSSYQSAPPPTATSSYTDASSDYSAARNFARSTPANPPPQSSTGPGTRARRGSKIAERYLENITKS